MSTACLLYTSTKTGEITVYGNLDVSVDTATKGIRNMLDGNGNPPVGNMGWLEDLSTNLAYVGVRGTQVTGLKDTNFIFQLETSVNISTAPGLHESNSQEPVSYTHLDEYKRQL